MSKLLLCCTKAKPKLMISCRGEYKLEQDFKIITDKAISFNGKIVAECDFKIEEIRYVEYADEWGYETNTLNEDDLIDKSRLSSKQLFNYLKHCNNGAYAIHIKNLHIFDEPRELYDCLIHPKIESKYYGCEHLSKAPQNMMYVELDDIKYILISIQPQWMCLILNRIKDVEVRKVVLKEMIK